MYVTLVRMMDMYEMSRQFHPVVNLINHERLPCLNPVSPCYAATLEIIDIKLIFEKLYSNPHHIIELSLYNPDDSLMI